MVLEDGRIVAVHNPWRTAQSKLVLTPDGWRREERSRVYTWLVTHSSLMRFVDKNLGHMLAKRAGLERQRLYTGANWHELAWTEEIQENVAYSMQVLRQIVAHLDARGIAVVVTGVPHLPQYSGEWNPRTHDEIGAAMADTGALYLNSFEALAEHAGKAAVDDLYFAVDKTHFNEAGNTSFAEIQFAFLMAHRERLFAPR